MIQSLPAGSQAILPFYFAARALTAAEVVAWEEGRGLPPGVGVDPANVLVEYWKPEASKGTTLESVGVTRTGAGEYQATVEALVVGLWTWRGVGQTGGGLAVAATPDQTFQVMRSRSN
jgi:hypothetical protein